MVYLYRTILVILLVTTSLSAASDLPIRLDRQVAVGSTVELTCDLIADYGSQVRWRKYQGVLNGYSRIYNGRLIISNVRLYDTGAYECFTPDDQFNRVHLDVRTLHELEKLAKEEIDRSFTEPSFNLGDDEVSDEEKHDVVADIELRQEPTTRVFNRRCDVTEATCRNGQCISREGLCDGKSDCADGSDETFCHSGYTSNKCEPNERPCRSNGRCIQKIWFCDGENDCDDGSDEECSDAATSSNGLCKSTEVACRDQKQCILKSFLCDKEFDCRDHSDEIGCVKPTITQDLNRNLTVVIGGTFKLQCKARGWPHPFINWRLNWGHVCEEPRCFSTNVDGCGVLTVTDARIADAGAYSCEAINSEGRVFATPDTLVDIHEYQGQRYPETLTCGEPAPVVTRPPEHLSDYYEEDSECECNNHSEDCTCSGYCLRCQHNTMGERCELCKPGYTGDATRGTPFDCLPTGQMAPTTTTPEPPVEIVEQVDCQCNNHTVDCTCSGYCLHCDHNTMGKYCHQCKPGYTGDATRGTPYDCLPANGLVCNPYGTKASTEKQCKCKRGVTGTLCDTCKANYFNFIEDVNSKQGCLSCFCNGLSVECASSSFAYEPLKSDFEAEFADWYVSNKFTKINDTVNFDFEESGVVFDGFERFEKEEVYFILPSKYKGNKLHSYGGNLTFEFKYTNSEGAEDLNFQNLELRLSGSSINIIHKYNKPIKQDFMNQIVIQLHEDQFRRYGDNGKVKKEFMLMALSNVELVMLKAKISSNQKSVMLKDFSMDVANDQTAVMTDTHRACKYIEVCECPEGYSGTSCQNCAPGYKRSMQGFYWGLCEPELKDRK